MLSRRGILIGLGGSVLAAPVIVRAASLMPVKALPDALLYGDSRAIWEARARTEQQEIFDYAFEGWDASERLEGREERALRVRPRDIQKFRAEMALC